MKDMTRLPTSAEWEFAAKGGANPTGDFTFAGSNNANDVAWHNANSGMTREVGLLQANCLGIHDMSGNVFEWVWDWWENYTSESTDPGSPIGSARVARGGSWLVAASNSRSVHQGYAGPGFRNGAIGFRLARP